MYALKIIELQKKNKKKSIAKKYIYKYILYLFILCINNKKINQYVSDMFSIGSHDHQPPQPKTEVAQ